jgi:hypothetical protein
MLRIAVVGAAGSVGRECLTLLDGGIVPVKQVVPVGSARNIGRDLGSELALSLPMADLVTLDDLDPRGLDVAVFSAGADVSSREAERLASAGVLVVDNSSAFRMRPDVPLVVPQVNPGALDERPASNLVANPNCSTIQLVRALSPLHELAGLESVVVATYQAASGGGLGGRLGGHGVQGLLEPAGGAGHGTHHEDQRALLVGAAAHRVPRHPAVAVEVGEGGTAELQHQRAVIGPVIGPVAGRHASHPFSRARSTICRAFSAAPTHRLSATTHSATALSSSGSTRMRPTCTMARSSGRAKTVRGMG